jgi:hypothetical protein
MTEVNMSENESKRYDQAEQILDAAMRGLADTTETAVNADVVEALVAAGQLALAIMKFEHDKRR